MSDNSNLADSNIEPSMEDILSSIRKVIAEDLVNEDAAKESQANNNADPDITNFSDDDGVALSGDTDMPEPELDTADDTSRYTGEDVLLDDIVEPGNLLTELPDPDTLTDDMGDVLELVILEDDLDTAEEPELEKIVLENTRSETAESANRGAAESEAEVEAENEAVGDFDDVLDLVLDSDASDYVTTRLAQTETTQTDVGQTDVGQTDVGQTDVGQTDVGQTDVGQIDVSQEETEIKDGRNQATKKAENGIFELDADTDQGLAEIVDKAVQNTIEETIEETKEAETTTFAQHLSPEDMILTDIENDTRIEPTPVTPVTPDEDMDLVKSLLADLMDEPPSEVDSDLVSEPADPGFSSETILADVADHSLGDQDIIIPEPHDRSDIIDLAVFDDTLVEPQSEPETDEAFDPAKPEQGHELESPRENAPENTPENAPENAPENTPESTLAQIAREVGVSDELSVEASQDPDDIVTLEAPDLVSKLALTSGVAVGATALAISAQDTTTDDEPESATPEPISPHTPPQTSTQEDETMATPMKNDTLSDVDTQAEAGNAFASLTSVVQEQAQIEENGPAIGELVKEALKPMLQEWLDKNLKTMVQRAVTKEIKRISSGK